MGTDKRKMESDEGGCQEAMGQAYRRRLNRHRRSTGSACRQDTGRVSAIASLLLPLQAEGAVGSIWTCANTFIYCGQAKSMYNAHRFRHEKEIRVYRPHSARAECRADIGRWLTQTSGNRKKELSATETQNRSDGGFIRPRRSRCLIFTFRVHAAKNPEED